MTISQKTWEKYIAKLRQLNEVAAKEMTEYLKDKDLSSDAQIKDAIKVAYALATKYGEGAAALSCEMYDAVSELSGAVLPAAEPAATATYGETAKTIYGILKDTKNARAVGNSIGRLVKMAGVDTTIKNGMRDKAQFAWIPHGDTCPFCLMLASNGWQDISKKALKKGHAEHIHNNCDCTYMVRFDDKTTVAGYDPDKYKAMYDDAEGDTWKEKVNFMRRKKYKAEKDLNKNGDPLFDLFGPISESNPDEIIRITELAKSIGVEVIDHEDGTMAYSPGLSSGQPGQLIVSKKDSIGAWLHEEQHMLDDEKDGFPGFAGLFDVDRRTQMEYNAYKREIDLAKANNRNDLVKRLKKLCKKEILSFGGKWDEKCLD